MSDVLEETADDATDETILDEEESTEETEGEEPEATEETEGQEENAEEDIDPTQNPFESLTSEQLQAIKNSPELAAVYKNIVRAYTKKSQKASAAMQLAEAYRADPVGVINELVRAQGLGLYDPRQMEAAQRQQQQNSQQQERVDQIGQELEGLFGKDVGPKVRDVFERFVASRAGGYVQGYVNEQVTPIQSALGQVMSQAETNRMMGEEAAFRNRHAKILTPQIADEIVKLGESGAFIPGPGMTPAQYLDNLLEVVMARRSRGDTFNANRNASTRLADRINKNRASREPNGVGNRGGVKKASTIKPGMSISDALDAAVRELEGE
jgi:hypothetical protein